MEAVEAFNRDRESKSHKFILICFAFKFLT